MRTILSPGFQPVRTLLLLVFLLTVQGMSGLLTILATAAEPPSLPNGRLEPTQDASGKVVGTVTDINGDPIAGAKITATNKATGISIEAVTDAAGKFQIPRLPVGIYEIRFEAMAFNTVFFSNVEVPINRTLRFDEHLPAAGVQEIIQINTQGAPVESANPTLGATVTGQAVQNLPLNGRNVLQLSLLQAGVTDNVPGSLTEIIGTNFSVSGSRTDSVTYLLDGGNNSNLLFNTVILNPNPDAVAEFRILTSNYTAEYGRNAGGTVSVVTRSGTNAFHGGVYNFLRNDALNANSFFSNRDGLPRDNLKRNQFGFTAGGPFTIPGLLDGRDRHFFFVSYQGQRQTQAQSTGLVAVYTPRELRGDFSLSNSTRNGPNQSVAAFLDANPFFQASPTLRAMGIIDPARINPVAQRFIQAGLIPSSETGSKNFQAGSSADKNELTTRFDFRLTDRDELSATLGFSRFSAVTPFLETNVAGFPVADIQNEYLANIAYTRTFSPTFFLETRMTATREFRVFERPVGTQPGPADLGINITPDVVTGPPVLTFAQTGMKIGFGSNGPANFSSNTFTYSGTATLIRGNHTVKFGSVFSAFQNNTLYAIIPNGRFDFLGPAGGTGSGLDRADFLFGQPSFFLQFGVGDITIRSKSTWNFAQDEWRVTPRLTLTYGLRYEYNQPKSDIRGRTYALAAGRQSQVFPNAPRGLLFPGDPGAPRGANFSDFNDIAPRFGFALAPFKSNRTSLRGGFGVFYDVLKAEDSLQFVGKPPFFSFSNLLFAPPATITGTLPFLGSPYLNDIFGTPNPFPSRPPSRNVDFAAAGFLPVGGFISYFVDSKLRTPYTLQYNLSFQQEILRNLVVEANYVGSQSRKLTGLVDANPFVLGTTTRVLNVGLPGPQFNYINQFANIGTANYNALHLSLTKRTSETKYLGTTGFTFAYTWSRAMDNSSGFRNLQSQSVPFYNTKQFYSASDTDLRHRLTISGGWDVPFDKWIVKNRLTTGWSLYPIFTYRTGFPLDISAGLPQTFQFPGPSGAGDPQIVRANVTGNVQTLDPRQFQTLTNPTSGTTVGGSYFFNPALFNRNGLSLDSLGPVGNPALRTYGTLGRNAIRGPSRTNFDLAIVKRTNFFGERLKTEFRAEFFNLPNLAQFGNPITAIGSPLFGQITTTADPRITQFALRLNF
jgi:hypothetical protein